MGFWSFLGTIAGVIIGAIITGVANLFIGRRYHREEEEWAKLARTPTQPVIVIAPATLVRCEVPLTDDVLDILEIPRWKEPDLSKPKLIVPGQGIVSARAFIEHSVDQLVFRAVEPIVCTKCEHRRLVGAYTNEVWVCIDCFYRVLKSVASGSQTIFELGIASPSHDWEKILKMLHTSKGYHTLSSDKTMQGLFDFD